MAVSIEGAAIEKLGIELADYLNSVGWEIELVKGKQVYGSKGIQALVDKEIDLAFIQNDLAHTRGTNDIRTVIPLFPNISYIFYRNHLKPKNLNDLLINNSVLVSKDDEYFYKRLFRYYGVNIDSIRFNTIKLGASVDEFLHKVATGNDNVLCVFAAIHTPHVKRMIENDWEIFSLGDIAFSNRGSSVEGFCMNYPRSEPFIVPRNFFGQKPELPIYTISMDELLIVHEDAGETLIYDLVNDIFEGKHYLSQTEILFNHVTEEFDQDALNFPLHDSTIDYLKRDEPTFFERYAEAFGVIFSILVVMIGGLTSLRKIRKERIDKYYRRVMACEDISELESLSNEAVAQLQNEKLTADESFTILLNLVEKRRRELENTPL
ncbi:MAG: hypothetical protein MI975_26315 [Cytophagales bacterium]|nr:hypothetical protein [Cytophagales bacterium]